ncbi:MAG: cysteine peptidase family C39 domain-containing protein [Chloroflexi bacterium]|nr:cysteine peptidase family C39 domain-containing protein [Chloroflexota bacterium]
MNRRVVRSAPAILGLLAIAGMLAIVAHNVRPTLRGRMLGRDGVVMQRTWRDCGLAAVATTLHALGMEVPDYAELLQRFPAPDDGFTMWQLKEIMSELGVVSVPWDLPAASLDTVPTPAIVHLSQGHYVVLLTRRQHVWEIADPMVGRMESTRRSVRHAFSGAALLMAGAER